MAFKPVLPLNPCPEKSEFQCIQIISRDTLVTNSALISLGAHQGTVSSCLGRCLMKMIAVISIVCRVIFVHKNSVPHWRKIKWRSVNGEKCRITILLISKQNE